MFRLLPKLLVLATLAAPVQVWAQAEIPQAVIEQCNAAASAARLPDCLKSGAMAWELIRLAQTGEFYAAAAKPIVEICASKNDTYEATWACFEDAAEKAVETRELIGVANIADRCVAGLSDPDSLARLSATQKTLRSKWYPDRMFIGGTMYFSFQGCPTGPEESGVTAPPRDGAVKGQKILDQQACSAYAEIGQIISANTPEALREIGARVKAVKTKDPDAVAGVTGLSDESAAWLMELEQDNAVRTAMLVGAFIKKYHPEFLDEAMDDLADQSNDPTARIGSAMGKAFVEKIIDTAMRTYKEECGPS